MKTIESDVKAGPKTIKTGLLCFPLTPLERGSILLSHRLLETLVSTGPILPHPVLGHSNTILTIVAFIRLRLSRRAPIDISFRDQNSGVIVALSNSGTAAGELYFHVKNSAAAGELLVLYVTNQEILHEEYTNT